MGLQLNDVRRREGLQALGVIPIQHEGRVIACLNVGSRRTDEIPFHARAALETIAAQTGTTISRLRSERERLRLAQAIDAVADAVLITSSGGTIEYANQALLTLTGYPEEELVGSHITS